MKFKRKEDGNIIEVTDKDRIVKFQSYPDLFEEVKKEIKPKFKDE